METAHPKRFVTTALPFAASAILLSVIQAPANAHLLAWVAMVPFIMAACSSIPTKQLLVSAYVVGVAYWLINMYWMMHVTLGGWLGMGPYLALYWPATAFALRFCNNRKVPVWLSAAVLFTGAEALQGWVFTGFPWRYLAHSQYANPRLIQIADIFGAAGVSFLIALVNGVAADIMIRMRATRRFTPGSLVCLTAALAAIACVLAYGNHRINESGQCIELGPMVAAVQPNVPQSVKESGVAGQAILDEMLKCSREAAKMKPALIAWPETMVTAYLNPELLACLPEDHEMRGYDKAIKGLAGEGYYVLVGSPAATPIVKDEQIVVGDKFNSAFLYLPDGTQSPLRYDKMHLVPFGEFVPFRHSLPPLYRALMWLTPYDYEYTLTAGETVSRFEITVPARSSGDAGGKGGQTPRPQSQPQEKGSDPVSATAMEQTYRFGVLICYEDTTPEVARKLVYDGDGSKRLDWLVNISNDGWFVRETAAGVAPTAELSQHTAICVFRAVENRVSILRSVNTGISTLIDPAGRIRNSPLAGSLPADTFERQGVSGWFADRITIDSRSTFFGAHGRLLDFCCAIALGVSIIVPVSAKLLRKRRKTAP